MKRLIITAGGTGGHIFPGISIALHLIEKGWEILWIGSNDRMESKLVPKYKIKINCINIDNLSNKKFLIKLKLIKSFYKSIIQIRKIISSWNPDIVLGTGGYISVPGGIAAWSLGIPLVIHEQNSVAGLSNKLLSKISCTSLQAFPETLRKAILVGNPIRKEILSLPHPKIRFYKRTGPIRVLVIGGSQGSKILNEIMPIVSSNLSNKIEILHQSGNNNFYEVVKSYSSIRNIKYKVLKFIDNIASAYFWADIAICRSGALTVSEISVVGLSAIFVPFFHKDLQQYKNAKFLEKVGAAKIFEKSDFTVEKVSNYLIELDRSKLLSMAIRAKSLGIYNATEKIVKKIEETLFKSNK